MGGRPRTFDTDTVLEKALDLFWRDGYASTSLQALLCHMGISRQSLYNTFGDKRSLFLAALTRYMGMAAEKLGPLEAEGASLPELQAFFAGLGAAKAEATPGAKRGCMVGRICMELGSEDPDVAAAVQAFFVRTEKAFENALQNAHDRDQIREDVDVSAVARHFTAVLHGMGLMHRAGIPGDDLAEVVRVAFSVIERP